MHCCLDLARLLEIPSGSLELKGDEKQPVLSTPLKKISLKGKLTSSTISSLFYLESDFIRN